MSVIGPDEVRQVTTQFYDRQPPREIQALCAALEAYSGFHPLPAHTRERWLSVAVAWKLDRALPAVEMIQAGDIYYVVDGHHRISVARAMGQEYMDAQVTVWQIKEHAEQAATVHGLQRLPA